MSAVRGVYLLGQVGAEQDCTWFDLGFPTLVTQDRGRFRRCLIVHAIDIFDIRSDLLAELMKVMLLTAVFAADTANTAMNWHNFLLRNARLVVEPVNVLRVQSLQLSVIVEELHESMRYGGFPLLLLCSEDERSPYLQVPSQIRKT